MMFELKKHMSAKFARKIQVPEGMLKAASASNLKFASGANAIGDDAIENILEAALVWLSNNPIVPDWEDIISEASSTRELDAQMYVQWIAWWIPKMFLVSTLDVPEEIKDMMRTGSGSLSAKQLNGIILEAFRRGQRVEVPA